MDLFLKHPKINQKLKSVHKAFGGVRESAGPEELKGWSLDYLKSYLLLGPTAQGVLYKLLKKC